MRYIALAKADGHPVVSPPNQEEKGMAKKDYKALAEQVVEGVGGKDNVKFVMHCATRLRFQLVDDTKVDAAAIKAIPGVIDLIIQNGQHQVCIGPDVTKAYDEVVKMGVGQGGDVAADAADEAPKKPMDRFFEVVSGIFTPIVPVLMASGMVGALVTILKLCGVLSETSSTYYILNAIYNAGFYFLPIFVAYTSAKKLNASPFLSMLLAAVLVHPNLVNFAGLDVSTLGFDALTFLGIPVPAATYSQQVLPIILGVWALSYVDRFFNRIFPTIVRSFMAPMCTMLVMVPLTLIVIGPLGAQLGNLLGSGVTWMGDNLGFLAVAILGFFTPVMIATGTHSFAFPVIVASITTLGFDQILMPSMLAENLAMAGAAMAIALTRKDVDERGVAISASLSAIMGISEPAMYGVNLPSKHGFLGAMIGGAVGGAFAGLFGFRMYMIASSSVVGIPAMFGDLGISNVLVGIATIVISFAAAFVSTWLLAKSGVKVPSLKKTQKEA